MGDQVHTLDQPGAEMTREAESKLRSSADHARYLETRTFGSLDGLRAVSILAVVWHHTHEGFPGWPITYHGFLGVDLFFVISGFLIVTLLLRERRKTGTTSLKNFYIRRFLRIFPPYYATLVFVGAVAFLKPGNTSAAIRRDLPYAALYVSNLVPMASLLAITWSLSVEEQFYLVIPTAQKLARRALPALLVVAYILVSLPPFGLFPQLNLPSFFRETTFGPILLGVMLAYALDHPRGYQWISRVLGHWLAPVFALALVCLTCSHPAGDISGFPRMAIHWSLVILIGSCVVRERHALAPVLTLWPIVRIGVVSYGIYLYHLIVRFGVDKAMKLGGFSSQAALFCFTALGTWMVAEVSYRLFETRFLALKSRWT
jgi:peptidoglycan/LPS O-acetylase OafA/YrhL